MMVSAFYRNFVDTYWRELMELIISILFWFVFDKFFSKRFPLFFLKHDSQEIHLAKLREWKSINEKKKLKEYRQTNRSLYYKLASCHSVKYNVCPSTSSDATCAISTDDNNEKTRSKIDSTNRVVANTNEGNLSTTADATTTPFTHQSDPANTITPLSHGTSKKSENDNNSNASYLDKICEYDEERYKTLKNYITLTRSNSTATLHAMIVTPLSIIGALCICRDAFYDIHRHRNTTNSYQGIFDTIWNIGESDIFWNQQSHLINLAIKVMAGYFVWDIVECIRRIDIHGSAFLIHAILSLLCTLTQIFTPVKKIHAIVGFFSGSESSTPFIHMRWMLLQCGKSETLSFFIFNMLSVFVFICYRDIFLPVFVFRHYWADAFSRKHLVFFDTSFVFLLYITSVLWIALNLFWTYKFVTTIVKKRKKKKI